MDIIKVNFVSCLFSILVTGCVSIPIAPNGESMAEIKGYYTGCDGSIRIVSQEGSLSSATYQQAGDLNVLIEAETRPGYDYGFTGDPRFMCSHVSRHEVSFKAKPRKSYRFWLVEKESGKYIIEVREADSPRTIKAYLIKSKSQQLSVQRSCRFYDRLFDCEMF